jgi:hypothetical protein
MVSLRLNGLTTGICDGIDVGLGWSERLRGFDLRGLRLRGFLFVRAGLFPCGGLRCIKPPAGSGGFNGPGRFLTLVVRQCLFGAMPPGLDNGRRSAGNWIGVGCAVRVFVRIMPIIRIRRRLLFVPGTRGLGVVGRGSRGLRFDRAMVRR